MNIARWNSLKSHKMDINLIVSNYELPIYSLTKASEPDINEAHKMIDLKKK
jgi:hypothetical protein